MTLYQRLNIRCYHRARSALGPLLSFADCLRVAPSNPGVKLPLAVRGFFENGGQQCFISQIAASDPLESGLARLDPQAMSILCCPGSYFLLDPEFSYWSLENGRRKSSTQREAFFVRCDLTTMTQNDLNNGSLILVVGVAPLQPAEFIFLKITIQI